ncbi:hypothetical protein [Sphaerisporangium sp. NPDC051011]|uniref:hypothetical protein n=1 Tax=Sphaerisporangium sp. NPDC051011 TaxID=3155792 RepID=UPI0033F33EF0
MDATWWIGHAGTTYAEDQMAGIGLTEIVLVLVLWGVPAVLLFFFIYWAIRLAIRHEKRRVPTLREIADQERRERVAAEHDAQRRTSQRRSE